MKKWIVKYIEQSSSNPNSIVVVATDGNEARWIAKRKCKRFCGEIDIVEIKEESCLE